MPTTSLGLGLGLPMKPPKLEAEPTPPPEKVFYADENGNPYVAGFSGNSYYYNDGTN